MVEHNQFLGFDVYYYPETNRFSIAGEHIPIDHGVPSSFYDIDLTEGEAKALATWILEKFEGEKLWYCRDATRVVHAPADSTWVQNCIPHIDWPRRPRSYDYPDPEQLEEMHKDCGFAILTPYKRSKTGWSPEELDRWWDSRSREEQEDILKSWKQE